MTRSILEYVILKGCLRSSRKRLGRLAALLRILSPPRTQGPALSLELRVTGFNSRAGLIRFPHVQANTSPVTAAVDARQTGCAALHACTHACTSPLPTHMPVPSSSPTMNLRVLVWRPGRVQQVPFSRASFLRGLSVFPHTSLRTWLSVYLVHVGLMCRVVYVLCVV